MAAKKRTTKPRAGRTESKTPHMTIVVVTESTGGLARHTMNTVLTQFPDADLRVEHHNFVDSKKSIQDAIVGLRPHVDVVVSTLADTELKLFMIEQAQQMGLDHFDITGGLIEMIADVSGCEPVNDSSVIHRQDKEYFDRMDALEFTLQHDDGRRLETIHQADL